MSRLYVTPQREGIIQRGRFNNPGVFTPEGSLNVERSSVAQFAQNVADEARVFTLPGYWLDNINSMGSYEDEPGYTPYNDPRLEPSDLRIEDVREATSANEAFAARTRYRRTSWLRQQLEAESSMAAGFFSALADPSTYIPIPLARGMGFFRAAAQTGVMAGAITTPLEIARQRHDPSGDYTESMFIIGATSLFGAALGGVAGAWNTRSSIGRALGDSIDRAGRIYDAHAGTGKGMYSDSRQVMGELYGDMTGVADSAPAPVRAHVRNVVERAQELNRPVLHEIAQMKKDMGEALNTVLGDQALGDGGLRSFADALAARLPSGSDLRAKLGRVIDSRQGHAIRTAFREGLLTENGSLKELLGGLRGADRAEAVRAVDEVKGAVPEQFSEVGRAAANVPERPRGQPPRTEYPHENNATFDDKVDLTRDARDSLAGHLERARASDAGLKARMDAVEAQIRVSKNQAHIDDLRSEGVRLNNARAIIDEDIRSIEDQIGGIDQELSRVDTLRDIPDAARFEPGPFGTRVRWGQFPFHRTVNNILDDLTVRSTDLGERLARAAYRVVGSPGLRHKGAARGVSMPVSAEMKSYQWHAKFEEMQTEVADIYLKYMGIESKAPALRAQGERLRQAVQGVLPGRNTGEKMTFSEFADHMSYAARRNDISRQEFRWDQDARNAVERAARAQRKFYKEAERVEDELGMFRNEAGINRAITKSEGRLQRMSGRVESMKVRLDERVRKGDPFPDVEVEVQYGRIPPEVKAPRNGKPVAAFRRSVDSDGNRVRAGTPGSREIIYIDRDELTNLFEQKAWRNPQVEGVAPLTDDFASPEDWIDFVLAHEKAHVKHRKRRSESKADYENRINQLGLEELGQREARYRAAAGETKIGSIIQKIEDDIALEEMELDNLKGALEEERVRRESGGDFEESWFHRVWNRNVVSQDLDGLTQIVTDWYKAHPRVKRSRDTGKPQTVDTDPRFARVRAKDTVRRIMRDFDDGEVGSGVRLDRINDLEAQLSEVEAKLGIKEDTPIHQPDVTEIIGPLDTVASSDINEVADRALKQREDAFLAASEELEKVEKIIAARKQAITQSAEIKRAIENAKTKLEDESLDEFGKARLQRDLRQADLEATAAALDDSIEELSEIEGIDVDAMSKNVRSLLDEFYAAQKAAEEQKLRVENRNLARIEYNGDGTFTMRIDEDGIRRGFDEASLPKRVMRQSNNADEAVALYREHELAHSRLRQRSNEDVVDYEQRINEEAERTLNEGARSDEQILQLRERRDQLVRLIERTRNDVGGPGSMMRRNLDIPSTLVEKYLVNNAEDVGRMYVHRMAPAIELAREFGDYRMADFLLDTRLEIDDEALAAFRRGNDDAAEAILEEGDQVLSSFEVMRDKTLGTFGRPMEPDALTPRAVYFLKNWATLAYMGKAGMVATVDAGKAVMHVGVSDFIKGSRSMIRHKELRELGADEVKLAGMAMQIQNGMRVRSLFDLEPDFRQQSTAERVTKKMTDHMFLLNGMNLWTDTAQKWAGTMLQHQIIDRAIKMVDGTATATEIAQAAEAGLDEALARRFVHEFRHRGGGDHDGMYLAGTRNWYNQDLVRDFRAILAGEVKKAIIEPGVADKPKFMSEQLGGLVGHLRGFMFVAHWRVFGQAYQQFGQRPANVAAGLTSMVALAYLVNEAKAAVSGYENFGSFDEKLMDAVETSAVTGIFGDMNAILETVTGNTFGMRPMLGMSPKFNDPNPGTVLGTAFGPVVNQWSTLVWALTSNEADESDEARALRYMLPFNNFWLFSSFFSDLQDGAANTMRVR